MSLLCTMFGHQPPSKSRNAGGDYGQLREYATDGIGRVHLALYARCPRCESPYQVAMTHLPQKFVPSAGAKHD